MTLHPDELAELVGLETDASIKAEIAGKIEKRSGGRGIDTGWILDEYQFFTKEKDIGKYWLSDGRIWGPNCAGRYSVDKEGRVLSGDGKPTGFYITEDEKEVTRVYGPFPDLPWMK